jgi:ribonuclease P protein component
VKRRERLRKRHEFDAAFREGKRAGDQLLGLRIRENGLPLTRAGFICGKAVGNAVTRNLVKRRLREAFRTAGAGAGVDCVWIARPAAAQASFQELRTSMRRLLHRVKAPGSDK